MSYRILLTLSILMFCSGFTALTLEMVWLRRLSLQLGSAGLSATVTLAIYMGGLGLGSWLGGRVKWKTPLLGYGYLELTVALWAFIFPWLLQWIGPTFTGSSSQSLLLAIPLLLPPALAHGATLPALSSLTKQAEGTSWLYTLNTFGAVFGVLGSAFLLLPKLGVRGTEVMAMTVCLVIFSIALVAQGLLSKSATKHIDDEEKASNSPSTVHSNPVDSIPLRTLLLMTVVGMVSMSLEIVWSRLGALLIGGSVYAFAVVLSVFLAGIAIGAHIGRKLSVTALPLAVISMGMLSILGAYSWRWLPHGLAVAWDWFGESSMLPAGALLLSIAMAGAPIASGMTFSLCLKEGTGSMSTISAKVLTANTIGGVLGVILTGPFLMPQFGIVHTTIFLSGLCMIASALLYWQAKQSIVSILGFAVLVMGLPNWDVAVYATGLYNRIGEFVDLSPRAIEQFAHEGWESKFYVDGHSASVAVGQSTKTNNLWLSINGKVDASTGADMPTQILSGELPLNIHSKQENVSTLVVGLASGVTANEAFKHGAFPLTVVELEPAIVDAARLFNSVNENIVDNPKSTIRVADARALLQHEQTKYDVIISEPSNPWITGVSNLFTVDYWKLGRNRLNKDGVFCQWVQLYALPPEGMRSLIASYIKVFPNTWLFETIPGSDALLISAPNLPEDLPIEPTLGPEELKQLAHGASLNTDDFPWIEFEAPKWVNRPTGTMNRTLIENARSK